MRALLHGCTRSQQAAIKAQIEAHPVSSTEHPLFLPVALLAMKRKIIGEESEKLWHSLVDAEMRTGQTGAPVIGRRMQSGWQCDINQITKQVIGVIQLSTTAEQHARTLLTILESVRKNLQDIDALGEKKDLLNRVGGMLAERLDLIE